MTMLELVLVALGPGGAAWVGVKSALAEIETKINTTAQDARDIKTELGGVKASLGDHGTRITKIETRMENCHVVNVGHR